MISRIPPLLQAFNAIVEERYKKLPPLFEIYSFKYDTNSTDNDMNEFTLIDAYKRANDAYEKDKSDDNYQILTNAYNELISKYPKYKFKIINTYKTTIDFKLLYWFEEIESSKFILTHIYDRNYNAIYKRGKRDLNKIISDIFGGMSVLLPIVINSVIYSTNRNMNHNNRIVIGF